MIENSAHGLMERNGTSMSMLPFGVREPLTVPQGLSWGWAWQVLGANGRPLDLTGWSILGQVRRQPGAPLLYQWSEADGNVGDVAYPLTSGWVVVTIPPSSSATATWAGVTHNFGVIVISPDQSQYLPVAYGPIVIGPTVVEVP